MPWHTYIIECKDGKLYTGITNNLERRIKDHNCGKGGRFTKYRAPVKLLYTEDCLNRPAALKREAQIKRLQRSQKLLLIPAGRAELVSYRYERFLKSVKGEIKNSDAVICQHKN